jgi:hypothetical protein
MNIFVTNPDPKASAKALDDKRVIKMILETAQILSTVIRFKNKEYADQHSLYKPTHTGHPCVKWAGQTKGNYHWLLQHMQALMDEYTARFGKVHKSSSLFPALEAFVSRMDGDKTHFVNCTDFKFIPDIHEAYKKALNTKWVNDKIRPRWTNSNPPEWKDLNDSKDSLD